MLSSYELNGKKDKALLNQAIKLADKLSYAWVGSNTLPYNEIDFSTNTPVVATVGVIPLDILIAGVQPLSICVLMIQSGIASVGTLTLEFGKLSELSGNPKYRSLAEGSVRTVANNASSIIVFLNVY